MRTTPWIWAPSDYAYVRIHLPWFPAYEGMRYATVPLSDLGGGTDEACERQATHRTLCNIDLREGSSLALADALLTEWERRAEDEPYLCACPNEEYGVEGEWAVYVYARIPEEDRYDLPPRISPDDFGSAFREWVRDMVDGMFGDGDGEAGL